MLQKKASLILITAILLVTAACVPFLPPPQAGAQGLSTLAAQTAAAQQTQALFETLEAHLSATPEQLPTEEPLSTQPETVVVTPTATLAQPTATLPVLPSPTQVLPTATPLIVATRTPIIPTIAPTPLPCNRAAFVSDVSIPDGTTMVPGEKFTKTWRLRNAGSCAWTSDYSLVFISGNMMGAPSRQTIGKTVNPGETADISIDLHAPLSGGQQTGFWQLSSAGGGNFGIGKNGDTSFWVKIEVKGTSDNPTVTYDFSANYCAAEWRSNQGLIECPTKSADEAKGSVTRSYSPKLEGGYQDDQAAIFMLPATGEKGSITGRFPAIKVVDGMDFQAVIGCADESPKCDVKIELNYSADGGPVENLASWTQTSDGKFQNVLLDLNHLAGKNVQFILTVYNNGDSTDDRVFWLLPAIR